MLFHVGGLRRLNEVGLLRHVARFSSVSGGSIIAAILATAWQDLHFGADSVANNFTLIEDRAHSLASKTLDVRATTYGITHATSAAAGLSANFRRLALGDARLTDLPSSPRFIFNSTNLVTGSLFRWSREYAADYRIGTIFSPDILLSDVVAASSAFPPFLSPLTLRSPGSFVDHRTRVPVADPPLRLFLTDGGVYDNLGLQSAESFHTVLVSDGGAPFNDRAPHRRNWLSQSVRTISIIDRQVRALRRRTFVADLKTGRRLGALWTLTTNIDDYPAPARLAVLPNKARALATLPTRLRSLPMPVQKQLVNFGYALADAALRSFIEPSLPVPPGYPYDDERLDRS